MQQLDSSGCCQGTERAAPWLWVVGGLGWLRIWGSAWEAGPGLLGFKGLPLLPSAEAAFLLGGESKNLEAKTFRNHNVRYFLSVLYVTVWCVR